jgi:hypothetical protein
MKAFVSHKTNGILLTFPNGNSLSTIWGAGSYSENYDRYSEDENIKNYDYQERLKWGSDTVEVMPICSDTVYQLLASKFSEECNGYVFGHMTFEKWLEMVNILNNHK